MADHCLAESIKATKRFFERSISALEEKDSAYAPKPGMLTVAQHVAHAAQTVEWFINGVFDPKGLPLDFETMGKEIDKVTSLAAARAWFDRACNHAIEVANSKTMADFQQPIAGEIMKGAPRIIAFESIADHTSHHRGSLAVYARLLGKVPPMPYM